MTDTTEGRRLLEAATYCDNFDAKQEAAFQLNDWLSLHAEALLSAAEAGEKMREALRAQSSFLSRAAGALEKMQLYATEYPKDSHVLEAKEVARELRTQARILDRAALAGGKP